MPSAAAMTRDLRREMAMAMAVAVTVAMAMLGCAIFLTRLAWLGLELG